MTTVSRQFDFNKNTYSIKADGEALSIESTPKKDSKYTKEDRLQELVDALEGFAAKSASMSSKNVQVLSEFAGSLKTEIEKEGCAPSLQERMSKIFQALPKEMRPSSNVLSKLPLDILRNIASFTIQNAGDVANFYRMLKSLPRKERESLLKQDAKQGSKIISILLRHVKGQFEKLPNFVQELLKKEEIYKAIASIDFQEAVLTEESLLSLQKHLPGKTFLNGILDVSESNHFDWRLLQTCPNITKLKVPETILIDHLENVKALTNLKTLDLTCLDLVRSGLASTANDSHFRKMITHLQTLQNLTELQLPSHRNVKVLNNTHMELICTLTNLKKLELLNSNDIELRDLTAQGIAHISKLTQLETLVIRNCEAVTVNALRPFTTLVHLREVDFRYCENVNDEALQFLDHCPEIVKLDIRYASITDAGLRTISLHSRLSSLDISRTDVTDAGLQMLKDANLPLTFLNIYGCDELTNEAMKIIAGFHLLEELRMLLCNQITDISPLQTLGNLKHLDLETATSENMQTLSNMRKLERLVIREFEDISDKDFEPLRFLTNLKHLELSCAHNLSPDCFKVLTNHTKLEKVVLLQMGCTTKSLSFLQNCFNLETLDLRSCKITSEGLEILQKFSSLKSLDLSGTKVDSAGVEKLIPLKNLEELFLNRTPINDAAFPFLAQMTSLTKLTLAGIPISSQNLEHLQSLQNLKSLDLGDSLVDSSGVEKLGTLHNLKSLFLRNTLIDDNGCAFLAQMTSLDELVLSFCKEITDIGFTNILQGLKQHRLKTLSIWQCPQISLEAVNAAQEIASHVRIERL